MGPSKASLCTHSPGRERVAAPPCLWEEGNTRGATGSHLPCLSGRIAMVVLSLQWNRRRRRRRRRRRKAGLQNSRLV